MTSYPADESVALFAWSQTTTGPTLMSHTESSWIVEEGDTCLCFRDEKHTPLQLVPRWRRRGKHEAYPSSSLTVARGPDGECYLISKVQGSRIPQIPPQRDWKKRLRVDYRFGPHDPMLYPQFWNDDAPYLAWIERIEPHSELYKGNIIGYVIQQYDWEQTYEDSQFGKLRPAVLARLREAVMSIHLLCIPLLGRVRNKANLRRPNSVVAECMALLADMEVLGSSFRETAVCVTAVQRGIAELRAFRLFRLDVLHHTEDKTYVSDRMFDMVGVFTRDEHIYDLLYRLGVPVWLVSQTLPAGVSSADVIDAVPWESRVEHTPLNSISYSIGERGRKQVRSRYDVSPPRYGPEGSERQTEAEIRRIPGRAEKEPRGRSASPRRLQGDQRGKGRGSQRVNGKHAPSSSRGAPRNPKNPWVRRPWTTDPGNQAIGGGDAMPNWLPAVPEWLRYVAGSVDRSVEREQRLCGRDIADPVPQWVFAKQHQTHAMPPFHLFTKSENRLKFTFPIWVALRDFWIRRVIQGETDGLDATTWRKVLDNKHRIAPALESWFQERAEAKAARAQRRTAVSNPNSRDAASDSAHLAETRKRLEVLMQRLDEVTRAGGNGMVGLEEEVEDELHGLMAKEDGEMMSADSRGDLEPDPVYGLHEPPKLAYIEEFLVLGKRLTREDFTKPDMRAYLVWEVQEATFRFQIRQLDTHLLKTKDERVTMERKELWKRIWGGQDGFVPSGNKSPSQTDPEPGKRLSSVYHFWTLVSTWPRYHEVPNLRTRTMHEGLRLTDLAEIEEAVWKFYAQTFFDYFGILPTIPTCMPRNPFLE